MTTTQSLTEADYLPFAMRAWDYPETQAEMLGEMAECWETVEAARNAWKLFAKDFRTATTDAAKTYAAEGMRVATAVGRMLTKLTAAA